MKIVSTAQMRELDRSAIEDYKVPGEVLMDRAGFGVANIVDLLFDRCELAGSSVLLVAGRGNNGGDAFAAARHLKEEGYDPAVWLAGSVNEIRDDARTHLNKLKASKIEVEELPTKEDWDQLVDQWRETGASGVPVVVDGVLGTGIEGPARGPAAGAIRYVNMMAGESLVVSIDIPSGLNSDTGEAEGDAVTADVTVTMGLPKRGLIEPSAANHVGRLEVMDIGIPRDLVDKTESDVELITAADVRRLFPRRPRSSHKGNYGHLLMIGGATGYSGAISMAARAAVRSGAGLVTAVVPHGIASVVAGAVPEAMVYGAVETEIGSVAAGCWPVWRERLNEFSAVLVGPGMTRHSETRILVAQILKDCTVPLVMDADALNVFEGRLDDLSRSRKPGCPLVITPHPGEMGRLTGRPASDVQANRFAVAAEVAGKTGAVVILKGAGTLVAEQGQSLNINMTGNPGMAAGGMGDVLAGLLGGLVARGLKPFDAARAAVFLHGRAGDEAAWETTESCLTAGDVIDSIPYAFQQVTMR